MNSFESDMDASNITAKASDMSMVEDDDDEDEFIFTRNLCWEIRNKSYNGTSSSSVSTYCYYGLPVVIPMSIVLVVSMVLAIVGNCMVILTIARHRGMRTRTNLLLANLAVADIMVASLDMPIALITIIKGDWIFSKIFCDFNGFAVGLGLMLSTHTLMWISIHKFISITRPFSRSVTPGKIVLMILAAWSWAIFYNLTPTSLIPLTDTEYKLGASQCGPGIPKRPRQYFHSAVNTICNLIGPFAIMTYCYYRIFKEVKSHLKRMRDFADVSARNSLIEQKQITETLCIVLSVFFLFWLPYIIYSLSLASLGKSYVPVIFNPIAYTFGYMNSACNPIIYALRSQSFRRGFKEIICGSEGSPAYSHSGSSYFRGCSTGRRNVYVGGGSFNGRDRENSVSNFGRMVVSFRRPIFGKENSKRAFKNTTRRLQANKNNITVTSNVGTDSLRENQSSQKNVMGVKRHLRGDNLKNRDIAYKPMDNCVNIKISHNVRNPKNQSEASPCISDDDSSQKINLEHSDSDKLEVRNVQEVLEMEKMNLDSTEVKNERYAVKIESLDSSFKNESLRERHASSNNLHVRMFTDDKKTSLSQPDVTLLPSQNLNISINGGRISSSNCDIPVTTLEIRDNQIRSVSVGDVSVTCSPAATEVSEPMLSAAETLTNDDGIMTQPVRKSTYPLMWQPSVAYLYGSPIISRRKFHARRNQLGSRPFEKITSDSCGNHKREKKISTSSTGSRNFGVASLITSVKKSITDLFNLDEDNPANTLAEHSDLSGAGESRWIGDGDVPSVDSNRAEHENEACSGSVLEKDPVDREDVHIRQTDILEVGNEPTEERKDMPD